MQQEENPNDPLLIIEIKRKEANYGNRILRKMRLSLPARRRLVLRTSALRPFR